MHFSAIFTKKMAILNRVENYCIGKRFKLVLKTTYKKLVLKYRDNAMFPSLCLPSENAFLSYFYSKNAHKSVENYYIGKKFALVLKSTYKKLFLKYQVNTRFPSLCLASKNAFLTYIFTQKPVITQYKIIAPEKKLPLFWRLPIRRFS